MSVVSEAMRNAMVASASNAILREYTSARKLFPDMHSAHEGWAVIKEEMDELWDEVRNNKRSEVEYQTAMFDEAVQIGAMAIAFMVEVCMPKVPE